MSKRHFFGALGVFVGCLLITATTSLAQTRSGGSSSSGGGRRDTMMGRETDIANREIDLRLLRESIKVTTPETSAEDRKIVVSQIYDDFVQIQEINRELKRVSSALDATSYKRISVLAEDMNKRAKRLKVNIGIPNLEHEKREPEKPAEVNDAELKLSLQTLSDAVRSFVRNPLFQEPRVTDATHVENLKRDISNMIEISHDVKKSAVKLSSH
jgi:hypothetical protein